MSEGNHWYTRAGRAMHEVPKASGEGMRATTLADARRTMLLPSVTGILSVMSKPQLESWKMNKVAKAALTTDKSFSLDDDAWARAVIENAFKEVDDAADLGTRSHAAIEAATQGKAFPDDLRQYVNPVLAWREANHITSMESEKVVVNLAEGYAGTMDDAFTAGDTFGVIDYKTRRTVPKRKVTAYDGQAMQLSAYAVPYWGLEKIGKVRILNVYISTTEPGRVDVIEHEDVPKHWAAFLNVCALWRYQNNYDPREAGKSTGGTGSV